MGNDLYTGAHNIMELEHALVHLHKWRHVNSYYPSIPNAGTNIVVAIQNAGSYLHLRVTYSLGGDGLFQMRKILSFTPTGTPLRVCDPNGFIDVTSNVDSPLFDTPAYSNIVLDPNCPPDIHPIHGGQKNFAIGGGGSSLSEHILGPYDALALILTNNAQTTVNGHIHCEFYLIDPIEQRRAQELS